MENNEGIKIKSLIEFPPPPKKFDLLNPFVDKNEYNTEEKLFLELNDEKCNIFNSIDTLLKNPNLNINTIENEAIKNNVNKLNSENEIAQIENSTMEKDFLNLKRIIENSTLESTIKKFFVKLSYQEYLLQDDLYLKKIIKDCRINILDDINFESINSIEKRSIMDYIRKLKNIKLKYIKEENIDINKEILLNIIYPENRKWDSYETFRYGDDIYDLIMRIYEKHFDFDKIKIYDKANVPIEVDEVKDKYLGIILKNIPEIYVRNVKL